MTQPQQPSSEAVFGGLEKLRGHMKLRVEDVIELIGVSRPTYYGWRNGRKMNGTSSEKALATLRNLMKVAQHPDWKKLEGTHLTIVKRRAILGEIMTALSAPADSQSQ